MKSVKKQIQSIFVMTALGFSFNAQAECYSDLNQIVERFNTNRTEQQQISGLSNRWIQSNSSDNKPISISLRENGDNLFVSFSQEGDVLGQGNVEICVTPNNNQFFIRPVGTLTPGPNAPAQLSSALTDPRASIRVTLNSGSNMLVRVSGPFGLFGTNAGENFRFNAH